MNRLIGVLGIAAALVALPVAPAVAKGPSLATLSGPGIDGEVAIAGSHADPWLFGIGNMVGRAIGEEAVDGAERWTLRWYWDFGGEGPGEFVEVLDVFLWPDGDAIGYVPARTVVGYAPGWYSIQTEAAERLIRELDRVDPAAAVAGFQYAEGRGFVEAGAPRSDVSAWVGWAATVLLGAFGAAAAVLAKRRRAVATNRPAEIPQ